MYLGASGVHGDDGQLAVASDEDEGSSGGEPTDDKSRSFPPQPATASSRKDTRNDAGLSRPSAHTVRVQLQVTFDTSVELL